jgi:predicted permease
VPGYEPGPNERMSIGYNLVSGDYFEAMGIPVLQGRAYGPEDTREGAPVLIVNQRFAERFWPDEENVVGKIVRTAGEDREVVGVVKNGKYGTLSEEQQEYMYLAQAQSWSFPMTVHLRTSGDPEALASQVRAEVARLDPSMPVADLRTMTNALGMALFPARLGGAALGLFGILGMILASVGIYSVMAYTVSRRSREIGIRVALGAARTQVVGLVLKKGMTLVLIGVALGMLAAVGASYLTAGILYGVEAVEPVTFVGVPALLAVVALAATWVPARRAASVDPMTALRSD